MATNNKYFQIAQPIERQRFLSLYRQVALLAKLVFAPYGIHSLTPTLLSLESFQATYASTFQQLEDVLSKCLFKYYGLEDDQVVATMHKYVGQSQDSQVS
jgi:hypothetical protein